MTGMDHLALWTRGVPLQKAYIRFAPKELAERWENLTRQTSNVAFFSRLAQVTQERILPDMDFNDRLAVIAAGVPTAIGPTDEFQKLNRQLQSRCLEAIRSGHILALAYAVPRSLTDKPAQVPNDIWQQTVDWKSGAVSAHGLRMESVRLVLTHWIPKIMADHTAKQISAITPKPVPRGRPTKNTAILDAFQQLVQAGRIHKGQKITECFPMVRALVKQTIGGTDDGMNDKTLHRILKPEFDKLR